MSTDTGNKLIVESPFASDVHKKWLETVLKFGEPEKLYSALKYHSSWDWLMPLVEKIHKIQLPYEDTTPTDTYCFRTFGMLNAETGNPMVRFEGCPVFEAPTLIEATYLAVVDFIESYNPQNS